METGPLTVSHSEEPVQPTLVCFSATLLDSQDKRNCSQPFPEREQ